jgi:hypothetical protein
MFVLFGDVVLPYQCPFFRLHWTVDAAVLLLLVLSLLCALAAAFCALSCAPIVVVLVGSRGPHRRLQPRGQRQVRVRAVHPRRRPGHQPADRRHGDPLRLRLVSLLWLFSVHLRLCLQAGVLLRVRTLPLRSLLATYYVVVPLAIVPHLLLHYRLSSSVCC